MRTSIKLMTFVAGMQLGNLAVAQGASQEAATKNLEGFAEARSEVLSLIGGATQQIRIVTDFLSDGDIASALYIAQYRKVNVQVLLGTGRATSVLSRLNFLKQQNIPVWLRPRGLMTGHPTVILVDQSLFSLNAELDYMARHRRFTLTPLASTMIPGFEQEFQAAAASGISPTPRPVPLVGRPGTAAARRSYAKSSAAGSSGGPSYEAPSGSGSQSNADGSTHYRYGRKREKPGNGIPTKLPRTTIMQDRSQQGGEHH